MNDKKKTTALVTIPFDEEQRALLTQEFPEVVFHFEEIKRGESLDPELWQGVEILYTDRLLPEPEQAEELNWVQFHYAGIDAFLDEAVLQKDNLKISTLSGANAPQVAEHALALMLALAHNLPQMFTQQSRNNWPSRRAERFQPAELRGKTVGILGYGSVGRSLAGLLTGFDVQVLASKREIINSEDDDFLIDSAEGEEKTLVDRLYPGEAVASLFKDCDFVFLCLPLTRETRRLIKAEQLAALKPEAFLVDVSRGGIIDHDDLIEALKNGQLAGAGLDVFPEEPLPADNPLWEMPNVIISPHVAGLSPHYEERALELFSKNLRRYLDGDDLLNEVDLARGY